MNFEIELTDSDFDLGPPLPPGCHISEGEAIVSECDSGDGIERTLEQCRAWAEHLGCDLKIASDTELFVDIDTPAGWDQFMRTIALVGEHFCSPPMNKDFRNSCVVTPSKSGLPKRHVVVTLASPQPLIVRIALQALLGSDGRREALSVVRALRQEENVVVFFEPRPKPPVEPPAERIVVSLPTTLVINHQDGTDEERPNWLHLPPPGACSPLSPAELEDAFLLDKWGMA